MRDYAKIEAWRLADDLTVAVYETSRSFPREGICGLTSQRRHMIDFLRGTIMLPT